MINTTLARSGSYTIWVNKSVPMFDKINKDLYGSQLLIAKQTLNINSTVYHPLWKLLSCYIMFGYYEATFTNHNMYHTLCILLILSFKLILFLYTIVMVPYANKAVFL